MRREYVKYKSSLERGLVAVRREKRARKADSDAEALPPVPGKDISPYDGRPASWWRESVGGGKAGRRAEGGGDEDGRRRGGRPAVGRRAGSETTAPDILELHNRLGRYGLGVGFPFFVRQKDRSGGTRWLLYRPMSWLGCRWRKRF